MPNLIGDFFGKPDADNSADAAAEQWTEREHTGAQQSRYITADGGSDEQSEHHHLFRRHYREPVTFRFKTFTTRQTKKHKNKSTEMFVIQPLKIPIS